MSSCSERNCLFLSLEIEVNKRDFKDEDVSIVSLASF